VDYHPPANACVGSGAFWHRLWAEFFSTSLSSVVELAVQSALRLTCFDVRFSVNI
jgi:hypothetical protein